MVGRGFTLAQLKRAIVSSEGGEIGVFYLGWQQMLVEDVIEAIEIVCDIQSDSSDNLESR